MNTLFWIMASFAFIVLASVATAALIVRTTYRRIRRSRTLNNAVLRNRARFSLGPQRRVLGLRVRLRDALDSGHAAIDLAVRNDGRRGELPRLLRRVEQEGLLLDTQLRLMESETDSAVLAREIPGIAGQGDQVVDMVRRLRESVATGLTDPSDDSLTTLSTDVDREAAALHAGYVALRDLTGRDRRFDKTVPTTHDRLQAKGEPS